MSLVIGVSYGRGVILAADPFVFDNNRESPKRVFNFGRIQTIKHNSYAFSHVGSHEVFHSTIHKLNARVSLPTVEEISTTWKRMNTEFAVKCSAQSGELIETLRPRSDSVLMLASALSPGKIYMCGPHGQLVETHSLAVCGSASEHVKQWILDQAFESSGIGSLEEAFGLVQAAFAIASADLFVLGYPIISVVTASGVLVFDRECEELFLESYTNYMASLRNLLSEQ